MNRFQPKKLLDSTIATTTSSFTYHQPYVVNGSLGYKMKNKA